MKAWVIPALAALLAFPAAAQITLTTYYTVLPTNGCNGLAAMGPASNMWSGGCTPPYMYVVEPSGCAQASTGWPPFWVSGDTVYTQLCSVPCQLSIWDASVGECVILCQIPVITAMEEETRGSGTVTLQNPIAAGIPLQLSVTGQPPSELTLFDAQGRIVERIPMASATTIAGSTLLRPGPYLLQIRWPDERVATQRVVVQ